MKKNFYLYACFGLLAMLALYACTKEFAPPNENETIFPVSEAREFFESEMTRIVPMTISAGDQAKRQQLIPAEYSPQWDKAVISEKTDLSAVSVPMLTNDRFQALRIVEKDGKEYFSVIPIFQKLVIFKVKEPSEKSMFILTLIPDREYLESQRGDICDRFIAERDMAGFTGIAMYSEQFSNRVVKVEEYSGGEKLREVLIAGNGDEIYERIEEAGSISGNLLFYIPETVSTRSTKKKETKATGWWDDDPNHDPFLIDAIGVIGNGGSNPADPFPPDRGDTFPSEPPYYPPPLHGGGGGGGNPRPQTPILEPDPDEDSISYTKEILIDSLLKAEQKKEVEEWVKDIMKDCMGGKLYNGLENATNNSQNYTIIFDDAMSSKGYIDHNKSEIRLGTGMRTEGNLFHELWHNFQFTEEADLSKWSQADVDRWEGSNINREIDAWCAMYMYMSRQEGFDEERDWNSKYPREITVPAKDLAKMLDINGQFNGSTDLIKSQMDALAAGLKSRKGYAHLSYDATRSPAQNLSILQKLAADCVKQIAGL